MAKEDKKADKKAEDKRGEDLIPGASTLTLDQMVHRESVSVVAERKNVDEVADLIAQAYKARPEDVKVKLEAAMEPLLKAEKAVTARKAAAEAAQRAEEEAQKAAVAAAEADGKVFCKIPHKFKLNLGDGKHHLVEAGTHAIPKEWAEHPYAKANGVEILK